MKFSIIIPVYNMAKYLDDCLQSVLCQDEKDYEVILIDDGSTDSSKSVIEKYLATPLHGGGYFMFIKIMRVMPLQGNMVWN